MNKDLFQNNLSGNNFNIPHGEELKFINSDNCLTKLTHWVLVVPYGVQDLGQYCIMLRLVTFSAPSHYLNQWWLFINWTLSLKLKYDFNWNEMILIQENAFENVLHFDQASIC